jgi:uncharacterized damage-inducible protein DinB
MTGETIVHAMACNNAWANRRLLAACAAPPRRQVHHRGQVRAMLSGAGTAPPLEAILLSDARTAALRAHEPDAPRSSDAAIWR